MDTRDSRHAFAKHSVKRKYISGLTCSLHKHLPYKLCFHCSVLLLLCVILFSSDLIVDVKQGHKNDGGKPFFWRSFTCQHTRPLLVQTFIRLVAIFDQSDVLVADRANKGKHSRVESYPAVETRRQISAHHNRE